MISFTTADAPGKLLADHYVKHISDLAFIGFRSGEMSIECAEAIFAGFSQMTALAAADF